MVPCETKGRPPLLWNPISYSGVLGIPQPLATWRTLYAHLQMSRGAGDSSPSLWPLPADDVTSVPLVTWVDGLETRHRDRRRGIEAWCQGHRKGQRATVCLSNQVYFHSTSSRSKTVCVLKRATAERNEDIQEKA